MLDLAAGVAVTGGLEVVLLASNLTGERYPLSSDETAPPAPGRGFGLSLDARW